MTPLTFEVDPGGKAAKQLSDAAQQLKDARPLFKALADLLESQTQQNFLEQGRPAWVPLSAATRAARMKRQKGSSVLKILQDHGTLAVSISSTYGSDFAQIGAGGAASDYAAIQQFGGTIERAPYSVKTRLRTDNKGQLLRQSGEGKGKNLAVFARDSHKRARESWHQVDAYKINIPARPYLPFSGPAEAATLQSETERSVLDLVERHLLGRR